VDHLKVAESAGCSVVRSRGNEDQLHPKGRFIVEHFRKGVKIGHHEFDNNVTNEGKNKLLNVMFDSATAITTWYLGLVDGAASPTLAAGDTYAQIGGSNAWSEWTAYTEAARLAWGNGAAASQSISNSSSVVFDINGSGSVFGLFVVGGGSVPATKGDHAGGSTLWAAAAFASGTQTVTSGDQLKVTYTVSC
jgi:hypothetical protein